MYKALAILKKDWAESLHSPWVLFFQLTVIFVNVLIFYYIAKIFDAPGTAVSPFLTEYGGKYFPFVLIGLALCGPSAVGLPNFSGGIGREIEAGTLEAILGSPTPLEIVLLFKSLWNFLVTGLHMAFYLALGFFFFGMDGARTNVPAVLASLLLTAGSLAGLEIFSAGMILLLKKGDQVGFFLTTIGRFISGVFFPVAVMPLWLQNLSSLSPLTYSLEALRKAILLGQGIGDIEFELRALAISALLLLPTGIYFFRWALERARKDGSLVFA